MALNATPMSFPRKDLDSTTFSSLQSKHREGFVANQFVLVSELTA